MDNRLREALAGGRFAITVEVVAPAGDGLLDEGLTAASAMARAVAADDRVAGLRVTDRVRADDDHDTARPKTTGGAAGNSTLGFQRASPPDSIRIQAISSLTGAGGARRWRRGPRSGAGSSSFVPFTRQSFIRTRRCTCCCDRWPAGSQPARVSAGGSRGSKG